MGKDTSYRGNTNTRGDLEYSLKRLYEEGRENLLQLYLVD